MPPFRHGKTIIFSYTESGMPYIRQTVEAGRTLEILKYFSGRLGKKTKPAEKRLPSPEAVQRANLRKAERELRWLMNANFEDGRDALVTWSFFRDRQPEGHSDMLRAAQQLVRKLRREYAREGLRLKYIYTMEIGPRGSRHIHMMISSANLLILARCWGHGPVDIKPLHSDGQYAAIASYFIKYSMKTEETEGRKLGRRWTGSHNLQKPRIRREVVQASTFREKIPEKPGYYIDHDRTESGENELTGLRYLRYTYIRERKNSETQYLHRHRHKGAAEEERKVVVQAGGSRRRWDSTCGERI